MEVKRTLSDEELFRILYESGLWETREEVETALSLSHRTNFDVIARDGGTIDSAIGEFFLDELGYIDRVPEHWAVYIDRERYGRDIRLGDARGRAVDELTDEAGRYGTDWKYFVIRWNPLLS